MSKFLKIYMIALLSVVAAGCTQNDGDISPYFGFWRLDSIDVDDEPLKDYVRNQVWSFQNNIICIIENHDYHERDDHWGSWSEVDGALILDFEHHDDVSSPTMYAPPAILNFPEDVPAQLDIVSQTSGTMVLSLVATDGSEYIYTLSKVYK